LQERPINTNFYETSLGHVIGTSLCCCCCHFSAKCLKVYQNI